MIRSRTDRNSYCLRRAHFSDVNFNRLDRVVSNDPYDQCDCISTIEGFIGEFAKIRIFTGVLLYSVSPP